MAAAEAVKKIYIHDVDISEGKGNIIFRRARNVHIAYILYNTMHMDNANFHTPRFMCSTVFL
jgi:hypothetical protein